MTAQVNIRFDDDTLAALDRVARDEGASRVDVVRDAVARRLAQAAADRIEAAYRDSYADRPETAEELRRAAQNAARLTTDETWEPWW